MKVKDKEWDEKEEDFYNACEDGDEIKFKKLMDWAHSKGMLDTLIHASEDYGFRVACQEGHFKIVKYLLTSLEIKSRGAQWANLHEKQDDALYGACINGQVEIMKYLMSGQELMDAGHDLKLKCSQKRKQQIFEALCRRGHEEAVRWWVESDDYLRAGHERPVIHGDAWLAACEYGDLNLVKYFNAITASSLKNNEDSAEDKDGGMTRQKWLKQMELGFEVSLEAEKTSVVNWFLMDSGMKRTAAMKKAILKNANEEIKDCLRACEERDVLMQYQENKEQVKEENLSSIINHAKIKGL